LNFGILGTSRLKESGPGLLFKETGSLGKTTTLSLRGSQAQEVAVFLEGVPLNSPSEGAFDFGELSGIGLSQPRVIRGGYSLLSSQPNGSVNLSLPDEETTAIQISQGSYGFFGLGIESPHIAISLEQGNFEFPFEQNGLSLPRTNNFSQRLNLRTWHRTKSKQIWLQLLMVEQGIPGSTTLPTPRSEMRSLKPLAAFQFKYKRFQFHNWMSFKQQSNTNPDYASDSENRWISIGHRTENIFSIGTVQVPWNLEWTLDKLWIEQNESGVHSSPEVPFRNTIAASAGILWNPIEKVLLHPRLRIEWLSDLPAENISAHPGLGLKYSLHENLSLISNIAWISRAPNFNEMYFDIPPYIEKNTSLMRQNSFQGDVGLKWDSEEISAEEVVFFDRTNQLLQDDPDTPIYKILNRGVSLSFGLESRIEWRPNEKLKTQMSHTLTRAKLGGSTRNYQPTHHLEWATSYSMTKHLVARVPFYYRSHVRAGAATIGQQFDLGVELAYETKWFTLTGVGHNLTGWNRYEVKDYPLGNEPTYLINMSAQF
jgi:hypothetical protein